ncbi:hypothetical protein RvY_14978 [Ramazzottius varieornatus]|uniref:Uncharacterized protein n=1 Tax=Ramazzottius varieornatus TaxID=947166 RepID=A0A1D1VUX7_RAMVA|nr:hypothetical protein RvY_14978 [Ramazzottius varieornatus]
MIGTVRKLVAVALCLMLVMQEQGLLVSAQAATTAKPSGAEGIASSLVILSLPITYFFAKCLLAL